MTRIATMLATAFSSIALGTSAFIEPSKTLIWNASASVPVGLYLIQPADDLDVTDLVAVTAPPLIAEFLSDRGYLPMGMPMMKRVLALPGQTVCREGLTVMIDAIAMGAARERDGRGRLLPVWQGCHVIVAGELFLMNWQSADSLDGRYFGPIPASAVIGRAHPVWIEKED